MVEDGDNERLDDSFLEGIKSNFTNVSRLFRDEVEVWYGVNAFSVDNNYIMEAAVSVQVSGTDLLLFEEELQQIFSVRLWRGI